MEGMTNSTNELNLKPRAIAVLVALRVGPLTLKQLQQRIGDAKLHDTADLLDAMATDHLVVRTDVGVLCDEDGRAWLESNGVAIAWGHTYDGMRAAGAIPGEPSTMLPGAFLEQHGIGPRDGGAS